MAGFCWTPGSTQFLDVNGHSLEAVCYGPSPEQSPTIVMLHEGLGCVELWRDFPKALCDRTGMGVFVFSRAGYGKSSAISLPRPLDYQSREAIETLPKVLDTIGFRNGILLGHSDGATISAIYAGSIEDFRVRGLILIAPHFFGEPESWASIKRAKIDYETTDLKEKLAKYHDNPDCAFLGWNGAWLHRDFRSWNVADVIDYFRIPVLAVQGIDDQYGTLAQIDELGNRIYSPLEKAILDDCGHSPHLEKPEETLAVIEEYVKRLNRIEAEQVAL